MAIKKNINASNIPGAKTASIRLPSDGVIVQGFLDQMVELAVSHILPTHVLDDAIRESTKYKQVVSSIKEVGIIEPLVVAPVGKAKKKYFLNDGHLRLMALKDLNIEKAVCLIASEDETYTYNKYVNRISPVQEHQMIRRAVENGVSEAKIAKALNLHVTSVNRKKRLLNGICDEAANILKVKMVAMGVFPILKRMKPVRQLEVVSLMCDAESYSIAYARALYGATPPAQLVNPTKPKKVAGLNEEKMARMESEMSSLQGEYKLIEKNYGTDVLNLALAKSYLNSLLSNASVVKYLAKQQPEILAEFQNITEMKSLHDQETLELMPFN